MPISHGSHQKDSTIRRNLAKRKLSFAHGQRGLRMINNTNSKKKVCFWCTGTQTVIVKAHDHTQWMYAKKYSLRRTLAHTRFARLHQQLCDSFFHEATLSRDITIRTLAIKDTVIFCNKRIGKHTRFQ
ncbi:hypothetical protein TNIN_74161 [Trichonephila inaurata madagascariensis]|uniref:Uncharacterized protein n=1 Tax=Trichonephila inaurata madagascariensis TaxID=2747483 RepID=A0A8X6YNX0_9ARAC|nr:hypothetical protein TNIN_74161 [Trichonephila inaurata madagascariensis]